jgi:ATP-dependent Lon protease
MFPRIARLEERADSMGALNKSTGEATRLAPPKRRRGTPADRDLARQVKVLHDLACGHGLWMEKPKSGVDATVLARRRPFYEQAAMDERLDWAKRLSGEARLAVVARLNRAITLGQTRSVAMARTPDVLEPLLRDFPNFKNVTVQIQQHLALCQLSPGRALHLPPILLSGSPGVGKTAYTHALAAKLSIPFHPVDVASLTAGFSLGGLDASYDSAKPGRIWDALDEPSMSPMILLDEVDKPPVEGSARIGVLYALLERQTARQYRDNCLQLPVDASHIVWIATCNDPRDVEGALRSRFICVEIEAPTAEQMPNVIRSVQRGLVHESDWSECFQHDLDSSVISALSGLTPREIRQALLQAYATAAAAGRRRLLLADIPRSSRTEKHVIGFQI